MNSNNVPGWIDPLCYEIRCEVLKAGRNLAFLLPTVLSPVAFYALFVQGMGLGRGNQAVVMLVTYCIFCAMAPGLFGVGTSISQERAMGWAALRRVGPLRTESFLLAKLCLALLYCLLACAPLVLFAVLVAGVALPPLAWLALVLIVALAGVFFAGLGMLLGLLAEQGALAAVGNLLFLPMAFLGGLWFPIQGLHPVLQQVGLFLPTYHFGQLALIAAGLVTPEQLALHLGVVGAWSAAMLALLLRAARNAPWYGVRRPA